MFRRHGSADWSQEIVGACSRRQTHILETAAGLVRPGGLLTYATCTFSPEENEEVIGRFLSERGEFSLLHPPQFSGFDRGRPNWVKEDSAAWLNRLELEHTVRIWPHRFAGEGHFIALLQRADRDSAAELTTSSSETPMGRVDLKWWHQFARTFLHADFPEERLLLLNGRLYLRPKRNLNHRALRVMRQGLFLGELRRGYFKPAHALALALRPDMVAEFVNWTADSNEVAAYLEGQSIREEGPDGWALVAVDHHGLGWAKRVSGVLKNHYPRGLRQLART
jgi:NOL1/NOP2/fmu family ribosome biogenesis protein